MTPFTVTDLPLAGLKCVARKRLGDSRGFLARLFCAEVLVTAGWVKPIAQINHTFTQTRGTVRGMHFQRPPHAEMKLVTCLRGEIFDVAVDVRAGSPTFLQTCAVRLSAENGLALLLPEGFAHGFQALSEAVDLLYCHSAAYAPQAEMGLSPTDPRLAIAWPLPIAALSARDATHPRLAGNFEGIRL